MLSSVTSCSPPGSSLCEISQARILEWVGGVAMSSSRGSSDLRMNPCLLRWQVDSLLRSHLGRALGSSGGDSSCALSGQRLPATGKNGRQRCSALTLPVRRRPPPGPLQLRGGACPAPQTLLSCGRLIGEPWVFTKIRNS